MSLLRIRGSLSDAPLRCQWALLGDGPEPVAGEGLLAELPRRAERIQLIIPGAQVLILRKCLPPAARRHAGSVLAYAVEDRTTGDPESNRVSWIGNAGAADVLAVFDKESLKRWLDALDAIGIHSPEVHSEALMLPRVAGAWSMVWDGSEGAVRTGEFECAATDCGNREAPPLSLRLMLDEAGGRDARPSSIALYATAPDAAPDIDAWSRELGISVMFSGLWDWRTAPPGAGVSLAQERQRWRAFTGAAVRLRPAAWVLGCALAIHAVALGLDWASLANEQRTLRLSMESRFRASFPDAVAVVDPALQMRRKLAEARHAAGLSDRGDFVPMLEHVAAGMKELPAGSVRVASYEDGRITLELIATEDAAVRRAVARLLQAGLSVDLAAPAARSGSGTTTIIVRPS
jgi:general secretion pathway protein L